MLHVASRDKPYFVVPPSSVLLLLQLLKVNAIDKSTNSNMVMCSIPASFKLTSCDYRVYAVQ